MGHFTSKALSPACVLVEGGRRAAKDSCVEAPARSPPYIRNRKLNKFLSLILLGLLGSVPLLRYANVHAQPVLPCGGCEAFAGLSPPASGFWYDPTEDGSGFLLETQGGILAGGYYGYTENGAPEWYIFSGSLHVDPEVGFFAAADLQRFQGGACLGCPYRPNSERTPAGRIEFQFEQRNYARYRIDGGDWKAIWTLSFGSELFVPFPDITAFPILRSGPAWLISFDESPQEKSGALVVFVAMADPREGEAGEWIYTLLVPSALELLVIGDIVCRGAHGFPECEYVQLFNNAGERLLPPRVYRSPIGFFGDSRFKLLSEDGSTMEGFRVGYN